MRTEAKLISELYEFSEQYGLDFDDVLNEAINEAREPLDEMNLKAIGSMVSLFWKIYKASKAGKKVKDMFKNDIAKLKDFINSADKSVKDAFGKYYDTAKEFISAF